jgi:serine/threonine protein kinase
LASLGPKATLRLIAGSRLGPYEILFALGTAPSDIFSFGCVLYEMLTGRRAFAKETPAQTMAAILVTPRR